MIKSKLYARILAVAIFFVFVLIYFVGGGEQNVSTEVFGSSALFVTVLIYRILLKPKEITQQESKHAKIKWTILFLLLILPGILYFYITRGTNNFVHLEVIGQEGHSIPDFKFINQYNDTITNLDYKDNIYVANFFFTSCPTICPLMTYNMRHLQQELKVYPNIKFLSHTVDPKNDTPERLLYYARDMRANLSNWNFVTGEKEDLYRMAPFYFANVSLDSLAPGGFLHSEYFILVDKEGRVRSGVDKKGNVVGVYDGTKDLDIKDLTNDIKVLMAEYNKPMKNEN